MTDQNQQNFSSDMPLPSQSSSFGNSQPKKTEGPLNKSQNPKSPKTEQQKKRERERRRRRRRSKKLKPEGISGASSTPIKPVTAQSQPAYPPASISEAPKSHLPEKEDLKAESVQQETQISQSPESLEPPKVRENIESPEIPQTIESPQVQESPEASQPLKSTEPSEAPKTAKLPEPLEHLEAVKPVEPIENSEAAKPLEPSQPLETSEPPKSPQPPETPASLETPSLSPDGYSAFKSHDESNVRPIIQPSDQPSSQAAADFYSQDDQPSPLSPTNQSGDQELVSHQPREDQSQPSSSEFSSPQAHQQFFSSYSPELHEEKPISTDDHLNTSHEEERDFPYLPEQDEYTAHRQEEPPLEPSVDSTMIPPEAIQNIIEEEPSSEQLQEKKTFFSQLQDALKNILEKSSRILKDFVGGLSNRMKFIQDTDNAQFISSLLKKVAIFLVAVIGLFAAYLLGASLHLGDYISQIFTPKKPEVIEVKIDPLKLKEWGIVSSEIFARNQGSIADIPISSIKNSYFFGTLAEPVFMGQTGISAAVYYGFLRDEVAKSNQFMEYLQLLKDLQNLYATDVYALLDRTPNRSQMLENYLNNLKEHFEKGKQFRQAIGLQVDDLKVSYNSLNPDKQRYETDFFAAMQDLAGEKADFLLKSFIDVSQKQISLRARLNALEKILAYYDAALLKVSRRIEAVEKNKDALIQGIRVIDVPGSNLDLIIKP